MLSSLDSNRDPLFYKIASWICHIHFSKSSLVSCCFSQVRRKEKEKNDAIKEKENQEKRINELEKAKKSVEVKLKAEQVSRCQVFSQEL